MRCEPLRPTEKPVQRWHGPGQRQQPERTPASGSGFLHSPGAGNDAPRTSRSVPAGKPDVQETFREQGDRAQGSCLDAWPPVSADPAPPDPAGLSSCMILLHDPAGQSSRTIQTLHNPDAAQSSSSCMKRPVSSTPCLWKRQGAFLSAVVCPLLQSLPFPDSPCQRTGTGRLLVPESVPWSAIPKQACPLSGKWSQGPRLMPGRPGASAA